MNRAPRATIARHASLHSPGALGSVLRMMGLAASVLVVSALAVAGFVAVDLSGRVTESAVTLEPGAPEVAAPGLGEYPGEFSVVLIGTDECGPESQRLLGSRCDSEGILNDMNVLVHVSDAPRRVTVVSLPRDLMVPVPACTREDGSEASAAGMQPLNSVYSHAGLPCVVKTISEMSDVPVAFAAKLSFDGVMEMTEAIGGVEVCIAEPIHDRHTRIDWPAGMRTVAGYEALQFLRIRHGIGDGSDLGRISNQQQYMSRLARKILSSEVLADPGKALGLANAVADNIVPTRELANPLTMVQLGLAVQQVPLDDFVFLQFPTGTSASYPGKLVPKPGPAEEMWEAVRSGGPLELTGDLSPVDGVQDADGEESEDGGEPDTTATPDPTASPRATLPPEVTGQTAEQNTCTAAQR